MKILVLLLASWTGAVRAADVERPALPQRSESLPAPFAPLPALPEPAALEAVDALSAPDAAAAAAPRAAAPATARRASAGAVPKAVPTAAAGAARRSPTPLASLRAFAAQAGRARPGSGALASELSRDYDAAAPRAEDDDAPAASASGGPSELSPAAQGRPADSGTPAPPRPNGPKKYLGFLPNLLTGLNLTSGLAAMMLLSCGGSVLLAGGLILLANGFDAFDGRAARWLGIHDPKGIEFDSLADVVSFGAAPALLIYKAALSGLGAAAVLPVALYAFAGLYRLGRFNVGAMAEAAGRQKKTGYFTGLPIPGGAGVVVALTLALPLLGAAATPVAVGVTLAAAAAMVSRLPYPSFKLGGSKALIAPVAAAAALVAGLSAAGLARLAPAAVFGAYLLTGPAIAAWRSGGETFRRELRRKAIHFCGLLYIPAYLLLGSHAAWAFGAWAAAAAGFEAVRLKVPATRPFFERFFKGVFRDKEAARPSGFFYAALGLAAVVAAFGARPALVCASIAALFIADAVSPLLGLRFPVGLYKVFGATRSWPGSLAAALAAFGVAAFFGFSPLVSLGAAAAFSAVDILPVKPDDNFWIPVAFSLALFFLSR